MIPAAAARLQDWIREQGHDGIIVKVPEMSDESIEGLPAARLRDSWEHSQIVVFDVEAEPGKPPREEAPPPRRPETGKEGLTRITGQQYIETLTTDQERDYATKYLNFKLGLEPDPGMTLPIEIAGMIRMEIDAIVTRVGLKPPTELPVTPEEAAPPTPEEAAPPKEVPKEPRKDFGDENPIDVAREYAERVIEGGGIDAVHLIGSFAQTIPSAAREGGKMPREGESDVDLLITLEITDNFPELPEGEEYGGEAFGLKPNAGELLVRKILEANPNFDISFDTMVQVYAPDDIRYFKIAPKPEGGLYAFEATKWGQEQEGARWTLARKPEPTEELPPTPEKAPGALSEFMDTFDAGTTFTLTEADIPEISQLEGEAQVTLDREKFLGTWTRGEAMRGDIVQLRWINSETGIALASSDFEPLGSTRMTAAIGRSMVV